MDKYGYSLDHDLIKFLNIFCTQMRIPDKLRNLIIAVISLCEHNVTATISIDSLQELLSNLSKNPTQKRISRTQLELLFAELRRQEYELATCLIWYQFCGDDSTILVRLDIMSSYDDVMQYAQNLATFDTDRTRAIHDAIVKLFIRFELPLTAKSRQKPTFETLGKKLGKITDLLTNFVDAGVDEKINFDDIRLQLAEIMDSISVKGLALAKRLDALELQQKQEQLLVLNTVENQLETQNDKIARDLTSSEIKPEKPEKPEEVKEAGEVNQSQKLRGNNENSNENGNENSNENNNTKKLNNTNRQLTTGYIRDLEIEAKNRLVNSVNIYHSNNYSMRNNVKSNTVKAHYT
ncbi:MAG: hypothetical protein WAQ98_31885 [Blastocatellia bacterium]